MSQGNINANMSLFADLWVTSHDDITASTSTVTTTTIAGSVMTTRCSTHEFPYAVNAITDAASISGGDVSNAAYAQQGLPTHRGHLLSTASQEHRNAGKSQLVSHVGLPFPTNCMPDNNSLYSTQYINDSRYRTAINQLNYTHLPFYANSNSTQLARDNNVYTSPLLMNNQSAPSSFLPHMYQHSTPNSTTSPSAVPVIPPANTQVNNLTITEQQQQHPLNSSSFISSNNNSNSFNMPANIIANNSGIPFTSLPQNHTNLSLNNNLSNIRNSATTNIDLSSSQIAARHVLTKDLPTFSGKPEEWPIFITNFLQSTERCGFSDQENLIRLQKSLKGPALDAVRGKLMMPSTVNSAIETLQMLFGRPDVIQHSLQCKLRAHENVKADDLNTLISLSLSVQNYCSTIQALGLNDYVVDPMLLNDLLMKLPSNMKLDWGCHSLNFSKMDLMKFDKWLFALATCASRVTKFSTSADANDRLEKRGNQKFTRERVLVHEVTGESNELAKTNNENINFVCLMCNGNHKLSNCSKFLESSVNDRWRFIKQQKLCISCFGKHLIKNCLTKHSCGIDSCKFFHNNLLHNVSNRQRRDSKSIPANSSVLFHGKSSKMTMFRYVPVTLYNNCSVIDTWALLDEGAACTLIETNLASELGLEGPSCDLCLRWTGDVTQTAADSKIVSLQISARNNETKKYQLSNVRTIDNLDLPEQSLDSSVITCREFLQGLPIMPYNSVKARILIGLDNVKIGVPLEIREDATDDLIASKCKLGWSIYGKSENQSTQHSSIFHICECSQSNIVEKEMDLLMKEYFALESVGISSNIKLLSEDDKRATKIMESTTTYLTDEKRWQTGLLWKLDKIELPNSLPMAKRRLMCLESKMMREPILKEFLNKTIDEYLTKGYVRKLKPYEITSVGAPWYIPIFTVTNVNKNKTRLVWDAAAKVNGVSLNSYLLKGPDNLISLVGVLLRFREKAIALCGDIREMFHQVQVRPEDQSSQMFLWRNGNINANIDVYCMQVMTFGASCSPSIANYIKDRNADRFKTKFPEAVAAIHQNTFVDDWLQCCDTEDEMIALAKQVYDIHKDGGFEMRNWISNSPTVLQDLTGKRDQMEKCLYGLEPNQEKILGMWWRPTNDVLTYVHRFEPHVFDDSIIPTKRQTLRVLMTIFDPLGLLGYYTIIGKIIQQDIWRSGVTWDQQIHHEQHKLWCKWVKCLLYINNLSINRCYPQLVNVLSTQLHIFVDAGINAYAAVAYLRMANQNEVQCCLISSKTRVAPLKPISIPRMELMAAVIGLRLAKCIEQELSIKIDSRVFWSDSKDVLYWIRSDARKFKQFVALRIGEILENSNVEEWRWIPSAENVADEGTKWSKDINFSSNQRWFRGPEFLWMEENDWPQTTFSHSNEPRELIAHIVAEEKYVSSLASISPNPKRFSRYEKLRRVQQIVIKFLQLSYKKCPKSTLLKQLFGFTNIADIESVIIRHCQEEYFGEEMHNLQNSQPISRKSIIYKCSPILDKYGVLRIRGRIDASEDAAYDTKRPIILPRFHATTNLIADYYHRRFHHHHNEIVVNEMRQRFWIHGMRALVRTVGKSCQICRNKRAMPCPPQMGDLPPERLASFTRPFTYTGVDYFGPIHVVVGRRQEKRWGVLFTCLTVRAVHIELSPSLSSDSFILVLKQFIARRGCPKRIMSDNGTNFRGASKILITEIQNLSYDDMQREFPEIEWRFIPPLSPHMGGAWERMIRSVKSVLMDIISETGLREEVLRAALADVENIINSRPLTYIPVESFQDLALTPNHFMHGSSSGIREKGNGECSGAALRKNYRISGQLANGFWKRWVKECLPYLTRRSKWFSKTADPISIDDVVIIVDDSSKRGSWPKGRVIDVHRSTDNQVRSAVVRTSKGLVTRPAVKLAKLDIK